MLRKIFYCNYWGAFLMLPMLFLVFVATDSAAQGACPVDVFEFEIEPVPPSGLPAGNGWRANSTNTKPGAFHAFYRVKLKAQSGNLPGGQTTFNYLKFAGTIKVNNFTSRINVALTEEYSQGQGQYPQYLDLSPNTLGNGEIVWEVGEDLGCDGGAGGGTDGIAFNFNGLNSITLFTICIEAVPGDKLEWSEFSAFVKNCDPECEGSIPVGVSTGTTQIIFPSSPPSTSPMEMNFEYGIDFGTGPEPHVLVSLKKPVSSLGKMDALIHIVPHMLGFSNLDFTIQSLSGCPKLLNPDKRKNPDGSFDIYFSFEDFPDPDDPNASMNSPQNICALVIGGLYNSSQGGFLDCSLTAGRWALGPSLAANSITYPLNSTPATVNIPGYGLCNNGLRIKGENYYTPTDCSTGIRFEFTHNEPQPLELSSLKFQLIFDPMGAGASGGGGSVTPGIVTSTLPDAATSGVFFAVPNSNEWVYNYDKQGSMLIENGMYVDVPITIKNGCLEYLVTLGEAVPTAGVGGTCALDINLGEPLCDPKVKGSVFLPNFAEAPYYRVDLKDFDSPYGDERFVYCEPSFSFCPDQSFAPFYLQARTHPNYVTDYLCINADNTGVTTYDMVLIQKHLLGIQPFNSVYQRIAANSDSHKNLDIDDTDIKNFRKLILGIIDPNVDDPNNLDPDEDEPFVPANPTWRYLRENLNINTPGQLGRAPSVDWQDASIDPVPINGIGNYGNFYAVKLGDLNNTCNCNQLRPAKAEDAENSIAKFRINGAEIRREGNTIFVPVYTDAPFELIALQGGFRFDPSLMSLTEIIPNPELPIYAYHFGLSKAEMGEFRFAWSPEQELTPLPGKSLLFTLQFELKPGTSLPQDPLCWASDNIMKNYAYQTDGTEYPVRLTWEGKGQDRLPQLGLVVSPNPFEENLTAYIYTEKPLKATLQLSDNRGTIYARQSLELVTGDNVVQVQPTTSGHPGVYFLTIEVDGQKMQRRVVKL